MTEEVHLDYTNIASHFYKTHHVNRKICLELLSNHNLKKQIKVLDFGCGTGNYIKRIREQTDFLIYGVEPCEKMRVYAEQQNPQNTIVCGDHTNIPFPDNFFDFIYVVNVIHHIEDLHQLFSEFYRVIKPNGLVCICTESRKDLSCKYWLHYFPSLIFYDFKRFPTIRNIITAAAENGFRTKKIITLRELKKTAITPQLFEQISKKSMSVMQLLPDKIFDIGLRHMRKDFYSKKVRKSKRGYTFLWLVKR